MTKDIGGSFSEHSWIPNGVSMIPLTKNTDDRGSLVELFREEWLGADVAPIQWNYVSSKPNVLRGIHVHHTHYDYLYMAEGTMQLALVESRRKSTHFGRTALIELSANLPVGIIIPPGVAHGFYFPEEAVLIYGVSHYWNIDDEMGCRWDDPAFSVAWSPKNPLLSERDQSAGSFEQMAQDFETKFYSKG
ncbi:MAG: hypothetical protein DRQ47_06280 [Gammaproteobacteria bacterium]|nr:MAG: hypothetical protein DRQ47_06280 [Gammaproteobacteria bacterium]